MKKTSTKKALICLGVLFFLLWSFIVSAITIDPWRFVATMRIQQVNLYYRITSTNGELDQDDIVKAWMTNYWWVDKWVLYIRPVDSTGNLVDETNNVVTNPDYASIIWWQMNTNNGDETTIMLWWSKNTAGGHWVVLMWWDSNTATVDNAVILWSHKSTVWSTNWVIMASDGWSVYWNNSTIFGWGWLIATWADNSFAIGWGVTINHQWVFSYGWWTSLKPNIAQFNGWQWIIVWWTKPNGNGHIKLSVNWALAVWRGQCSQGMIWSIYYKAGTQETSDGHYTPTYCLCACVTSGSAYREIALSNQPYCNGVCECQSEDPNQCHPSPVKCWTRWALSGSTPMAYAHWEKWWRVASRFCEDNRPPRAYQVYAGWAPVPWKSNDCWVSSAACNPPFPEPGETVKWICHWVWYYDDTECSAYRDLEAPDLAECGDNSRRYNYYDTGWDWTDESDFCRHVNWAGSADRSHNWELTEFRVLTEEEVEIEYKSGILLVPYATWENYLQILNKLKSPGGFPVPGWRTYWKCETSNAWNEVWGREVTNEKICYADRMPCNTCAKDGFPYCFSVNFSDECNCTDPAECPVPCLPGAEHAWENELHISWNTQEVTDSLRIANNEIDNVRNEGAGFNSSVNNQEVTYSFPKNETNEVKKYSTRFTTVTGSVYCSWTTTISQCPKWHTWDNARLECVKDRCIGTLAAWAYLPTENEQELESSLNIFLTWASIADSHKVKCASRCAKVGETYRDRKGVEHVADMDLTMLINQVTGEPFCAKCEEWTAIPEAWWCEFKDPADCMDPYRWFDIENWKCALPWTCEGIDLDRIEQDVKDIVPIANTWGTPIDWSCVSDLSLVDGKLPDEYKNSCTVTCKKPYICSQGSCEEPVCHWSSSNSWQWLVDNIQNAERYRRANYNVEYPDRDKVMADNKAYADYFVPVNPNSHSVEWNNKFRFLNSQLLNNVSNASFHFDVHKAWTQTVQRPTLVWEPWIFVEAEDQADFDYKTTWLKWCFYWCTWSDFRMELKSNWSVAYYCSIDPDPCEINPESCQHPTPTGTPAPVPPPRPVKRLCSGSIPIKWKYKYSTDYWYADDPKYANWTEKTWEFSSSPTSEPCKYWCAEWYQKKKVNDVEYCWRECKPEKNEYAVDYVCYTCPSGTYPTTWEVDMFGNPRGCWSKCNASQYISSNGYCYSCGAGKKWNPKNKDSHWNSKDCVNICDEWRTYWTNRKGKTDCGTDWSGKPYPNCCLSTYANASYNNKCETDTTHCKKVGANCVCNYNMGWV